MRKMSHFHVKNLISEGKIIEYGTSKLNILYLGKMNNQEPPNESTLFNYEEFSARFGTLDQRNFMETSPIRGAHSSPPVPR